MNLVLGLDIGGTGIKGGVVDTDNLELTTERKRILTPESGTPDAILDVVIQMVDYFDWKGKPVSIGFPSLIKKGICLTANNIDKSWVGVDMIKLFSDALGVKVTVVNDADAAGMAEWGLIKKHGLKKDILMITLGTGVGSFMVFDEKFIPNTELGSLLFKNGTVEDYISNKAREEKDLSYKKWGKLVNTFLVNMERVFSPDIIILGGGICKKFHKYNQYFTTKCEIRPAEFKNAAGVIGAAMASTFK